MSTLHFQPVLGGMLVHLLWLTYSSLRNTAVKQPFHSHSLGHAGVREQPKRDIPKQLLIWIRGVNGVC